MTEQSEQEYLNGPNGSGDRRAERTKQAVAAIEAFIAEYREGKEQER